LRGDGDEEEFLERERPTIVGSRAYETDIAAAMLIEFVTKRVVTSSDGSDVNVFVYDMYEATLSRKVEEERSPSYESTKRLSIARAEVMTQGCD
jgi:hypothetical protein